MLQVLELREFDGMFLIYLKRILHMPKVFLCHSSADKQFVRRLAQDLNRQNIGVWVDEKEILVGDPIRKKIEEGLTEADYLAIVLSPNSIKSPWVQKELDAKLIEEIESKRVIVLPILAQKCSVPPFLRDKHYADFTGSYDIGLNELMARLKLSDREAATKLMVLEKLVHDDMAKVDPHQLIGLAISARQIEAATELISVHQSGHPNCPVVAPAKASIEIISYQTPGNAEAWPRALRGAMELIKGNPVPPHFQHLEQLAKAVPATEPCATACVDTLNTCLKELEDGQVGWRPQAIALLIKACHRLPLGDAKLQQICAIIYYMVRELDAAALRPCISGLLHVGTHLADKFKNDKLKKAFLQDLFYSARIKVGTSQEYSDAFLHLAWAAAQIGNRVDARKWLDSYRMTVTVESFAQGLEKHTPLRDIAAEMTTSVGKNQKLKNRKLQKRRR